MDPLLEDKEEPVNIGILLDTEARYRNAPVELKKEIQLVKNKGDPRIIQDPIIKKFLNFIFKRYYRIWFFIRGIPKIVIPILISSSSNFFKNLNINGCSLNGIQQKASDCIACNGESMTHEGNLQVRYVDYLVVLFGLIFLVIILRRGISEAHLSLKALKYKVHVRASWYYCNHLLLIILVGFLCGAITLFSSVFTTSVNADEAQIVCKDGALKGEIVLLKISGVEDNLFFWITLYAVAVFSYWPVILFLVDLYDTPLKIFIEPEDMFRMNGEIDDPKRLFERLSETTHKVRLKFLLTEIRGIYKELGEWTPYFIETIPDEVLQVAILRLYHKKKMKDYKSKFDPKD